ncbi:MAG: ADP-ribosylation factor-like protein [Polyangiales bacterium]|nr:gliding motility protein [Myxococcales bacterium]MCB9662229.1 gliding motility protein [Sandaracinaceae bacterium]
MAQVNPLTRELLVKLVYYGPGLGGKTTSLQRIHQASPAETRGQIVSLATPVDRTLYFDFLPLRAASVRGHHVRLQLFTVPGQVYFNATRKLVLTGADGVVFVADSQRERHDANLESLENLMANLETHGRGLGEIPLVLQYNKRDLPHVMDIEELDESLNPHGAPAFPTCAADGEGVLQALDALVQAVMDDLEGRQLLGAEPKPRVEPEFHRVEEALEHEIGRASAEVWRADEERGYPTDPPPRSFQTYDTSERYDFEDLDDSVAVVPDAAPVIPLGALRPMADPLELGSVGTAGGGATRIDGAAEEPGAYGAGEDRVSRVTYTRDAKTVAPPRLVSEPPSRPALTTTPLPVGGPSWAPLFDGEAAGVRLVELDLSEGRIAEALARLDGLVQRTLRDVAERLELPDQGRHGVLVASLLGISPSRWVRFRDVCSRARAGQTLEGREALSALALLVELRERQVELASG